MLAKLLDAEPNTLVSNLVVGQFFIFLQNGEEEPGHQINIRVRGRASYDDGSGYAWVGVMSYKEGYNANLGYVYESDPDLPVRVVDTRYVSTWE